MIQNLRENYDLAQLERDQLTENPIELFERWFNFALEQKVLEPNAMTLATVNAEGKPTARIVLFKGFDDKGFVFYTNYDSQKGQNLANTPFAALLFNWLELHKQIRIEGKVERLDPDLSTKYFQSRPKGSQIGAWASPQSQVIEDRTILEKNTAELESKYQNVPHLPRPPHWGGYIVEPTLIEFWQGRPSRLHDRFRYTKNESGNWQIDRLAP